MINVTINVDAIWREIDIDENMTLRGCLEEHGGDYDNCEITLNGCRVSPDDLDKTFASFGYDGTPNYDKCYLLRSPKFLRNEDFANHEAFMAYHWMKDSHDKLVERLLCITEGTRKVSFAWKVARTLMLAAAYAGLAYNAVPWYMYLGVICVALTWGFSESFADYE